MDDGSRTPDAPPALAALHAADAAVGELLGASLWTLPEHDLLDLRIGLESLGARLAAASMAATREIDGRGAAVTAGATSTAAWLRGRLLVHPGAARREVALARELDGELAATGAALAAGTIGRDQAAAVADALEALPVAVDPATRRRGETFLLDQAQRFDPSAVHRMGQHLLLTLDPERGAALERDEAAQGHHQELKLTRRRDGSRGLRGRFSAESGALLDAALDAVAGPRPSADDGPDPRPAAQRRAEGLVELVTLATQAPGMPEHGGEPVTLTVTTTLAYLQSAASPGEVGPGAGRCGDCTGGWAGGWSSRSSSSSSSAEPLPPAATYEDGSPISPETLRRLGCDGWVVAALTDIDGAVLDIGRLTRVVPLPMRRALVARDGGCAFPGCGRPPRWCQAHHVVFWALGGPTALDNLVLLCGHHHRAVHHDGWKVLLRPRGRPEFVPPPWVDPAQAPRPAWRPPHGILRL